MILGGKVALVAHDAGGAEILSSWIRRNPRDYVAVLGGPAEAVFNRKLNGLTTGVLNEAVDQCDWVLCGIGNSDFEYNAILSARNSDRYVVAFLDHWTAYGERFIRGGVEMFPDEIWVGDEYALQLAKQKISEVECRLVPNPYWIDVIEKYRKLKSFDSGNNVLYASTNIDDFYDKQLPNVTDYWVLERIIESLRKVVGLHQVNSLTIRRHPTESTEKYGVFSYPGLNIRNDCDNDLVESIAKHAYVVGCNSMALVIGKLCGKRTINFLINEGYGDEAIPDRYVDRAVRLGVPEAKPFR